MSGGDKHDIRLLKWKDIYSLVIYTSIISNNFNRKSKKKKGNSHDARDIYNFKKYFKNSDTFKVIIEAVAKHYKCTQIVSIPASTTEPNSLQKLFGSLILRHIPTEPRKYNHSKPIDDDYKNSYSISHDLEPQKILLIDDICTTGKTINYFAEVFENKGFEVVKFSLALDYKLEPEESDLIEVEFPEETDEEKEEKFINKESNQDAYKKYEYKVKVGRKLKIKGDVKKRLIAALENGMFIKRACTYAGISESLYYKYIQRAEEVQLKIDEDPEYIPDSEEEEYLDLVNSFKQCEATTQIEALDIWKSHWKKDWRAIESFMAKRFPDEFGNKPKPIEFTDKEGDAILKLLKEAGEDYKDLDISQFEDPQYD